MSLYGSRKRCVLRRGIRMADKRVRNESVEPSSPDLKKELLVRLRLAVPDVFSEGELDLEKLRELAGDGLASGPERFSFGWAGKRDAIALLQRSEEHTSELQ